MPGCSFPPDRSSILTVFGAVLGPAVCATALAQGPPASPAGVACQPGQVQVLVLGTFHFAQQNQVDLMTPVRQAELNALVDRLATFSPDRVTVEFAFARNDALNEAYARYLAAAEDAIASPNETYQIGFRLARRLGHHRIYGVDVPMNLWDDSVSVFDDEYPGARERLRGRWNVRYPPAPRPTAGLTLSEMLRPWNDQALPAMPEYGRFMPLVEGDVYAGALTMRRWYDRNLRIVQNFFRVLEPGDDRLFMVVGGSHVAVLRHLLDATPQLCAVDPLPFILSP